MDSSGYSKMGNEGDTSIASSDKKKSKWQKTREWFSRTPILFDFVNDSVHLRCLTVILYLGVVLCVSYRVLYPILNDPMARDDRGDPSSITINGYIPSIFTLGTKTTVGIKGRVYSNEGLGQKKGTLQIVLTRVQDMIVELSGDFDGKPWGTSQPDSLGCNDKVPLTDLDAYRLQKVCTDLQVEPEFIEIDQWGSIDWKYLTIKNAFPGVYNVELISSNAGVSVSLGMTAIQGRASTIRVMDHPDPVWNTFEFGKKLDVGLRVCLEDTSFSPVKNAYVTVTSYDPSPAKMTSYEILSEASSIDGNLYLSSFGDSLKFLASGSIHEKVATIENPVRITGDDGCADFSDLIVSGSNALMQYFQFHSEGARSVDSINYAFNFKRRVKEVNVIDQRESTTGISGTDVDVQVIGEDGKGIAGATVVAHLHVYDGFENPQHRSFLREGIVSLTNPVATTDSNGIAKFSEIALSNVPRGSGAFQAKFLSEGVISSQLVDIPLPKHIDLDSVVKSVEVLGANALGIVPVCAPTTIDVTIEASLRMDGIAANFFLRDVFSSQEYPLVLTARQGALLTFNARVIPYDRVFVFVMTYPSQKGGVLEKVSSAFLASGKPCTSSCNEIGYVRMLGRRDEILYDDISGQDVWIDVEWTDCNGNSISPEEWMIHLTSATSKVSNFELYENDIQISHSNLTGNVVRYHLSSYAPPDVCNDFDSLNSPFCRDAKGMGVISLDTFYYGVIPIMDTFNSSSFDTEKNRLIHVDTRATVSIDSVQMQDNVLIVNGSRTNHKNGIVEMLVFSGPSYADNMLISEVDVGNNGPGDPEYFNRILETVSVDVSGLDTFVLSHECKRDAPGSYVAIVNDLGTKTDPIYFECEPWNLGEQNRVAFSSDNLTVGGDFLYIVNSTWLDVDAKIPGVPMVMVSIVPDPSLPYSIPYLLRSFNGTSGAFQAYTVPCIASQHYDVEKQAGMCQLSLLSGLNGTHEMSVVYAPGTRFEKKWDNIIPLETSTSCLEIILTDRDDRDAPADEVKHIVSGGQLRLEFNISAGSTANYDFDMALVISEYPGSVRTAMLERSTEYLDLDTGTRIGIFNFSSALLYAPPGVYEVKGVAFGKMSNPLNIRVVSDPTVIVPHSDSFPTYVLVGDAFSFSADVVDQTHNLKIPFVEVDILLTYCDVSSPSRLMDCLKAEGANENTARFDKQQTSLSDADGVVKFKDVRIIGGLPGFYVIVFLCEGGIKGVSSPFTLDNMINSVRVSGFPSHVTIPGSIDGGFSINVEEFMDFNFHHPAEGAHIRFQTKLVDCKEIGGICFGMKSLKKSDPSWITNVNGTFVFPSIQIDQGSTGTYEFTFFANGVPSRPIKIDIKNSDSMDFSSLSTMQMYGVIFALLFIPQFAGNANAKTRKLFFIGAACAVAFLAFEMTTSIIETDGMSRKEKKSMYLGIALMYMSLGMVVLGTLLYIFMASLYAVRKWPWQYRALRTDIFAYFMGKKSEKETALARRLITKDSSVVEDKTPGSLSKKYPVGASVPLLSVADSSNEGGGKEAEERRGKSEMVGSEGTKTEPEGSQTPPKSNPFKAVLLFIFPCFKRDHNPHKRFERWSDFLYPQRILCALWLSVVFVCIAIMLEWIGIRWAEYFLERAYNTYIDLELSSNVSTDTTVLGNEYYMSLMKIQYGQSTDDSPTSSSQFSSLRSQSFLEMFLLSIFLSQHSFPADQVFKYAKIVLQVGFCVSVSLSVLLVIATWIMILRLYRKRMMQARQGRYFVNLKQFSCIHASAYVGDQVSAFFVSFVISSILLFISLVAFVMAYLLSEKFREWIRNELLFFILSLLIGSFLIRIIMIFVGKKYIADERHIMRRRVLGFLDFVLLVFSLIKGLATAIWSFIVAFVLLIVNMARLDYCKKAGENPSGDIGFCSYVGMFMLDSMYNDVLLLHFVGFLNQAIDEKRRDQGQGQDQESLIPSSSGIDQRRRTLIRNKWHVAYTLIKNPKLRRLRKGFGESDEAKFNSHEELGGK